MFWKNGLLSIRASTMSYFIGIHSSMTVQLTPRSRGVHDDKMKSAMPNAHILLIHSQDKAIQLTSDSGQSDAKRARQAPDASCSKP